MRVIIAGGGTGGHLFPAIAVGEELKRQFPDIELLHVGASNGIEAKWFPRNNIRYELLDVHGLTGKDALARLKALGEFLSAINRARMLLKTFRPELVVGTGGYSAAPTAMAAILSRVPLVILEQNVRPGLANRLLGRFARKICVGFAESAGGFGRGNIEITGNPVRFAIPPRLQHQPHEPFQILVLGGSTGAHRLNIAALNAFVICRKHVIKINVVHQTGEADVGLVSEGYQKLGCSARVLSFIDDIGRSLELTDLVVARSGAMTVSEVALAGRAAIFVPYPFHRDRQQEFNARVLERRGGARIVADDDHCGENLARELYELTSDPPRLVAMGQRAHEAAMPEAAEKIARICFEVMQPEQTVA